MKEYEVDRSRATWRPNLALRSPSFIPVTKRAEKKAD